MPVTRVGTPPLITAPAHQWNTTLTVLMQAQAINVKVVDMAWIEADLYGPSTVSQMLEGNHVKQSESAHLVTLKSFFILYLEAFLTQEAGHCKERLTQLAGELEEAWSSGEKWKIPEKHKEMVKAIESMDIMERMAEFDR